MIGPVTQHEQLPRIDAVAISQLFKDRHGLGGSEVVRVSPFRLTERAVVKVGFDSHDLVGVVLADHRCGLVKIGTGSLVQPSRSRQKNLVGLQSDTNEISVLSNIHAGDLNSGQCPSEAIVGGKFPRVSSFRRCLERLNSLFGHQSGAVGIG